MSRDQWREFFREPLAQSQIKGEIVRHYFYAWAKVMISKYAPRRGFDRIAYVDLCSGPGAYETGEPSTPLHIMNTILRDPEFCCWIESIFNDADQTHVASLRERILALPGIDRLAYPPRFTGYFLAPSIVSMFANPPVPSFTFLDPLGYKALISRQFLASVIRPFGCDCLFFFNYRRINRAISTDVLRGGLYPLFGRDRVERLRNELASKPPKVRERIIVDEFRAALVEVGISHPLMFRVRHRDVEQTSHHLVFISTSRLAHHLMKSVLAKYSDRFADDVLRYQYSHQPTGKQAAKQVVMRFHDEEDVSQTENPLAIEVQTIGSIEHLKRDLMKKFRGQSRTVRDIYFQHHFGTPYYLPNYKQALIELEAEGKVTVDRPAESRCRQGRITLGDDRIVTFANEEN